jgi:membrane protease YdiL (CAAX protease family)
MRIERASSPLKGGGREEGGDKTALITNSLRLRFLLITILAVLLFVSLFIFRSIGPFDFWWWMSANLTVLLALSFFTDRSMASLILSDFKSQPIRKIGFGILSALLLYGVFLAGNWISRRIFPFADSNIARVYGFKEGASILRLALLMAGLIGPGEEFFWRGYIQRHFQVSFGGIGGWLLGALFYAAVHVGSGNFMLVAAAAACGLFWGFLYLRFKSVLLVAVSHTLWDVLVFFLFPLGP